MNTKPPTASRPLPFRTASAASNRPNLLEKLMNRPTVANVPQSKNASPEEQDAVLNGMTRCLDRRVSGLNLPIAIRNSGIQRHAA